MLLGRFDQRLAAVGALCGIALGVVLLLRQVNWPGVWHPLGVAARSCLHWLRFRAGLPVRAGWRCNGLSTRCVLALARMLGHEDPSLTLRTYADLFDSDLDTLADVLDRHRTAALWPSTANADDEREEENVPGTLQQTA